MLSSLMRNIPLADKMMREKTARDRCRKLRHKPFKGGVELKGKTLELWDLDG